MSDLTTQVNTYETLLRELYPRLDSSSAQHVDQLLGGQLVRVRSRQPQHQQFRLPVAKLTSFDFQQPDSSAPRADAGVAGYSLATVDHTEEDFNRDDKVQAMGFVGEHSEIAWLYRLKRDLDQNCSTLAGENSDRPSISSVNYFHDDTGTGISTRDSLDLSIRPPRHVADKLVDDYFHSVHPAFPIIGKELFLNQYRYFYSQTFYWNANVRPKNRWLAMLNLVFAIAARHSLLVENTPSLDPGDHLVYFARAWRLSIGHTVLLDHPNLQQVQVEGLIALYLLAIGQVNRCVCNL